MLILCFDADGSGLFVKVDPDALVLLGEIGARTSLRYISTKCSQLLQRYVLTPFLNLNQIQRTDADPC